MHGVRVVCVWGFGLMRHAEIVMRLERHLRIRFYDDWSFRAEVDTLAVVNF